MNFLKIIKTLLFVSALILIAGTATIVLAQDNSSTDANQPQKYTAAQQTCITNALKAQQTAMTAIQNTFDAATKDAMARKQAAMKLAQDTFNAAVKSALEKEQAARTAAQKITDPKARNEALKAEQDAFNGNAAVKKAKIPYLAAMKAANDTYQNDSTVKQAMGPYTDSLKAAKVDIKKACLGATTKGSAQNQNAKNKTGIWQSIKNLFKKSGSALINAFTFIK